MAVTTLLSLMATTAVMLVSRPLTVTGRGLSGVTGDTVTCARYVTYANAYSLGGL